MPIADPIACMLCKAYDYKIELEDTMEKLGNRSLSVTVTSDQSKADYACWINLTKG